MKRIKIILTIVLTMILTVVLAQPSFAGNFANTNISAFTDSDYLYGEYSDFTVNNYIESYVCARYNTQSPNDNNAYLGIDYFFNYYDDLCNYKLWASKIRYDKTDSYGNYVYEITGDDPIVNIIPKNLFTTENTTAYLGNEYGFYINTTKIIHCNNGFFYSGAHYGENHEMMVSKVFLYDIKNDRSNVTSDNISFIPLAAFEFVCIKSNSYYCDHTLCEYYSKTNNIVMPSCFRMRENQIGYLDYKFSNVCYSAEILGNSELDENGLYENDSNVPFITTVSGTHTFSTAIEKTEETTVTFGDIYRMARLCRDYVLMFTGDVAALVRVVIKNGVYMYNEFKKIDFKCESGVSDGSKEIVCYKSDFENEYSLQLERYQLPIRDIGAIDSFTSENYISCNTSYTVDFINNSYTTNDQCLNYNIEFYINAKESFVIKESLNYDLYDEDGNKIDFIPTNNIIEKNIYKQENVSNSFSQNIFGGAGYEVDYSFM